MRILLMTPIFIYKRWPKPRSLLRYFVNVPSVSLPQLAACITNHYCEILDGIVTPMSIDAFKKKIKSFDVIGINTPDSFSALNIELNVRLIKKVAPQIKVILGGHHATAFHTDWINRGVDFVVRGEGEVTFPELIEAIDKNKDFENVEGITYADDGQIIVNPDRPFIQNLDDLPIPRWELLDFKRYSFFYRQKGLVGSIETSRGCPHKCTFCLATAMWRHTQRYKSIERVIRELKILKDFGVTRLFFVDDNIGGKPERNKQLYQMMIEEELNIVWNALMRIDDALNYPEIIDLASRSGCKQVCVGLESMSTQELNDYCKGLPGSFTPSLYADAYRLFRKNDIFVLGVFLISSLDTCSEDILQIINLIHQHRFKISDTVAMGLIRPFPGTEFYQQAKKRNMLANNPFYYEESIPNIKEMKKVHVYVYSLAIKRYLSYLFNPKEDGYKIFSRRKIARDYFRSYYYHLLSDFFHFNYNGFCDSLKQFIHHNLSERERQEMIVNKYINKKFIDKL